MNYNVILIILTVAYGNRGVLCRMNVLFLIADDLRPELASYYGPDFPSPIHPPIHSPNIDALAKKSLLLKRAYVQQAVCSPSRTSFLTGRRPDTTHVYDLVTYFRNVGGNFTTIPQYFKQHGYRTVGMGKIFHDGKLASNNDDPLSWTDTHFHAPNYEYWQSLNKSWIAIPEEKWREKPLPDEQIADHAISTLRTVAQDAKIRKRNFFVAVGFRKPHLPFVFPDSMLKFYPVESIRLPANAYAPQNMPKIAWVNYSELSHYKDIALLNASRKINTTLPDAVVRNLRRAYYSALTWTDLQVGRVMTELERLGLENDTVVSFLGDHGWQLGEHGEWCKHTNFEIATHAPMMIRVPGLTDNGVVTDHLTEFVDLFPTLVEAAGLGSLQVCPEDSTHVATCTEGTSLLPLMKNPNGPWKSAAFSQFHRRNRTVMGYTMRTDRYRYTEWVKFSGPPDYKPDWSKNFGTELYDHGTDPEENINIAVYPQHASLVRGLSGKLRAGWRKVTQRSYPTNGSNRRADVYIILLLICFVVYTVQICCCL